MVVVLRKTLVAALVLLIILSMIKDAKHCCPSGFTCVCNQGECHYCVDEQLEEGPDGPSSCSSLSS